MSVVPEANPLYEDVIVVASMTQRQVNTQYGTKPIFDIVDNRERKFSTFKEELATQIYNLALPGGQPNGAQIRVRFREKPSSDPSRFPPNLNLESAEPATAAAMGDGAQGAQGFAGAPVASPPFAGQPSPVPATQPASGAMVGAQAASAAGQIPASTSGVTDYDRLCMRRSAALKAAAYYHGALGGEMVQGDLPVDFWTFANQCLEFIETGADPIPFLTGGEAETSQGEPEEQHG